MSQKGLTPLTLEYEKAAQDDDWALETIRNNLGIVSGSELQGLQKKERDSALKRLKAAGLTVRQIERLTGISRNIIQRAE